MDLVLTGVQKGHPALVVCAAAALAGTASATWSLTRPRHELRIAELPQPARLPVELLAVFRRHGPDEFDRYLDAVLKFAPVLDPARCPRADLLRAIAFDSPQAEPVWEAMADLHAKYADPPGTREQSGHGKAAERLIVWTRVVLAGIVMDLQKQKQKDEA
jgi:hypothetical protein